jgi:16S rRNA (cytosine967-C5)-methyltransferase
MRLGAYQLLFMTRTPAHAAVHATVELAGRKRGFLNAVLRRLTRMIQDRPADPESSRRELALIGERCLVFEEDLLPDPRTEAADHLAVLYSLPVFLLERWIAAHGVESAARLAEASSSTPAVFLRHTARAGSAAALAASLAEEGVSTEASEHPCILRWTGGSSPFAGKAFAEGWFVAQDPTALRAAEALGAQEGERILDLCAAPGTKASFLADQVGSSGRVHAFDAHPERRKLIRENAARLGLSQIECMDSLEDLAAVDRVIIDVPCSNSGVLARRVEARERITQEAIMGLAKQQRRLLERGWELLRDGGVCLYSTCSIEAEENQDLVEAFARERGLMIRSMQLTLPEVPRHDGGFHALLEKGTS